MQLLFEEFFRKIFKFINEIHIFPIRVITKMIFYFLVLVIFSFIAWMIYTKKYIWIIVFVGLFTLGELAHFIRKSREKQMTKVIESKNDLKDEEKNPLNKEGLVLKKKKKIMKKGKVINEQGVLPKKSKVMNKPMLLSKKKIVNKQGLLPKKNKVINKQELLSKK